MRKATVYGREIVMQGSPYTFIVFQNEFQSDLMQAILAAYETTPPKMGYLLKIAWAMAKTHSDDVEPFKDWIKNFDKGVFSLDETPAAVEVIDSAIYAELFRYRATHKWREWLYRFLDALAKHARGVACWIRLHDHSTHANV